MSKENKQPLNIKTLGQVFTQKEVVLQMIDLIQNNGRILEPSAGAGAFSKELNPLKTTSIEYDKNLALENNSLHLDFFSYSIENKFDTVIGNPPYVRFQDISETTKELIQSENYTLFDRRSNLYIFFIYKAILHLNRGGELIFITPRDFLKATSCARLNQYIFDHGTITSITEMGDRKIWDGATPNTIIWRFEKDNFSRKTDDNRNFSYNRGQLLFTKGEYPLSVSDICFVKVGAVSGADSIFEHEDGVDVVCSYTQKTGNFKRMLLNVMHPSLEDHREKLISRKIKKFTEDTWFHWGRAHFDSDLPRIYVNSKTRNKNPFFLSRINIYDGSILALFFPEETTDEELIEICGKLNEVEWGELGFIVDNRFLFSQKSLENAPLPESFRKFILEG